MWYLKKILKNPVLYGAIALLTGLMCMGCYGDLAAAGENKISVIYCYIVANSVGISHVLVPVVTSIPFLSVYVEEHDKKLVYYQIIRSKSRRKYYGMQWLAALATSLSVAVISLFLFTIVCLLSGAGFGSNDSMKMYFEGTYFADYVKNDFTIRTYLIHCFAFLLYASPWPLIGMLVSSFSSNKYVIMASPFIALLAGNYITELLSVDTLHPGMTLLIGNEFRYQPYGGIFHTIRYFTVLIVILTVILSIRITGKMKNEGL